MKVNKVEIAEVQALGERVCEVLGEASSVWLGMVTLTTLITGVVRRECGDAKADAFCSYLGGLLNVDHIN